MLKFNDNRRKYYVVPVYLSGGSEADRETDFNSLWDCMSECSGTKNLIVISDLNGRVGDSQELSLENPIGNNLYVTHRRTSKDNVINKKRRKIVDFYEYCVFL